MKKMRMMMALFCAAALCICGCDDGSKSNGKSDSANNKDVSELISDDYFRQYCLRTFDTNYDGKLSQSEADAVKQIILNASSSSANGGLEVDFSGVEYFKNLEYFDSKLAIGTLDLSQNTKLTYVSSTSSAVDKVNLRNTNLTSIGVIAFGNCIYLTSIEFPESLTLIDNSAFGYCTSLTSIELPDGITSIGANAFSGCDDLTSVKFPEGLISIGVRAFSACRSLTSIELPEGLTLIDIFAFLSCSSLTNVTSKASNPPTLGTNVFDGIGSNPVLYVPSGREEAYASSDWGTYFSDVRAIEE